jgi:hypothetical protein
MAERTTEQAEESDVGDDADVESDTGIDLGLSKTENGIDGGDTGTDTTETDDTGGYLSLRALIVSVVAIGGGMTLGGLIPLIPYTGLLGIPLGAFVHGLLDSRNRYVETSIAGGALSGIAVTASLLPQLVAGLNGARLFAVSAAIGLVVAVLGHYFGRDLRAGITQDL